jgi:hypothetical protein
MIIIAGGAAQFAPLHAWALRPPAQLNLELSERRRDAVRGARLVLIRAQVLAQVYFVVPGSSSAMR